MAGAGGEGDDNLFENGYHAVRVKVPSTQEDTGNGSPIVFGD